MVFGEPVPASPQPLCLFEIPRWLTPWRKSLHRDSPFACSDVCLSWGAKFQYPALRQLSPYLLYDFPGSSVEETRTVRTRLSATSRSAKRLSLSRLEAVGAALPGAAA